jgi:hypothetical protein
MRRNRLFDVFGLRFFDILATSGSRTTVKQIWSELGYKEHLFKKD